MIKMKKDKNESLEDSRKKILNDSTAFQVKEAYKVLRTNIMFSLPSQSSKIIAMTSASASEGKTTNAVNLAISFAETGAKVLLIDADLRRPNVARMLKEKSIPGLSNALLQFTSLEKVIKHTSYENLDAIYSGDIPPNPAELLSSPAMEELLQRLAPRYDYIFIDTPPVNIVTDTTIISRLASGVVVAVEANATEKTNLVNAVSQLEFVEAKILGFILHHVVASHSSKYKKYYKYGYEQ